MCGWDLCTHDETLEKHERVLGNTYAEKKAAASVRAVIMSCGVHWFYCNRMKYMLQHIAEHRLHSSATQNTVDCENTLC